MRGREKSRVTEELQTDCLAHGGEFPDSANVSAPTVTACLLLVEPSRVQVRIECAGPLRVCSCDQRLFIPGCSLFIMPSVNLFRNLNNCAKPLFISFEVREPDSQFFSTGVRSEIKHRGHDNHVGWETEKHCARRSGIIWP